jgi:hypothetical protein
VQRYKNISYLIRQCRSRGEWAHYLDSEGSRFSFTQVSGSGTKYIYFFFVYKLITFFVKCNKLLNDSDCLPAFTASLTPIPTHYTNYTNSLHFENKKQIPDLRHILPDCYTGDCSGSRWFHRNLAPPAFAFCLLQSHFRVRYSCFCSTGIFIRTFHFTHRLSEDQPARI